MGTYWKLWNITNNHLELGENMLGTIWNIMGTPKIVEKSTRSPLPREKRIDPVGACWLTSLGAKNFYVDDNGKGHELSGHRLKEFGRA